jgi:hypothetical protein
MLVRFVVAGADHTRELALKIVLHPPWFTHSLAPPELSLLHAGFIKPTGCRQTKPPSVLTPLAQLRWVRVARAGQRLEQQTSPLGV